MAARRSDRAPARALGRRRRVERCRARDPVARRRRAGSRRADRRRVARHVARGTGAVAQGHLRRRVQGDAVASSTSTSTGWVLTTMARMTMIEAIRDAHAVAMERDDTVVVFGEDVGYFGGVFRCTKGLQAQFGKTRCFDAPVNESGIVGAAIGMGANGLRPCVEIQFADYMYPAFDQIVSEAARLRHRSAGEFTAPLTIRMPFGGGIFGGQTHSQSPEALFT